MHTEAQRIQAPPSLGDLAVFFSPWFIKAISSISTGSGALSR